jgi:hypothetical protein
MKLVFPAQERARQESGGEREEGALLKEARPARKQRVGGDA